MKAIASYNLQLEVGQGECECGSKEAHCHVTRNGLRLAKLFLNPVSLEEGHLLKPYEVDLILELANANTYDLLKGFVDNRDCPKDY
jgi:hypothetical protein